MYVCADTVIYKKKWVSVYEDAYMNTSGSGLSGLCMCVARSFQSLFGGLHHGAAIRPESSQRLRGPLKAFLPLFYYMHKFLLVIQLYVVFMNTKV